MSEPLAGAVLLAALLRQAPGDHLERLEGLRPLLTADAWTELCEALEVCPTHVRDAGICRDDQTDCAPGAEDW